MISRIEVSRPPGVSIRSTSELRVLLAAPSPVPRCRWCAVAGPMAPSTVATTTGRAGAGTAVSPAPCASGASRVIASSQVPADLMNSF